MRCRQSHVPRSLEGGLHIVQGSPERIHELQPLHATNIRWDAIEAGYEVFHGGCHLNRLIRPLVRMKTCNLVKTELCDRGVL